MPALRQLFSSIPFKKIKKILINARRKSAHRGKICASGIIFYQNSAHGIDTRFKELSQ